MEIDQMKLKTMLNDTLTKIVKVWAPMTVFGQVNRQVLGEKNVSRITTIEDALRHIHSGARDVRLVVHVLNFIDRPAMRTHPHLNVGMRPQSFGYLDRALQWFLRAAKEEQRHPVAGREAD